MSNLSASQIDQLIAELSDTSDEVRKKAADELRRMGEQVGQLVIDRLLTKLVTAPAATPLRVAEEIEPDWQFDSDPGEDLPIATRRLELVKICLTWGLEKPASAQALYESLIARMPGGFTCEVTTVKNDLANLRKRLGFKGNDHFLKSPGPPNPSRFNTEVKRLRLAQKRLEEIVVALTGKRT